MTLPTIVELLTLKKISKTQFRADYHQTNPNGSLFGGQLVAQALMAANQTLFEAQSVRTAHAIHAHFMRAGNAKAPVLYEVLTLRDGKSFSLKQITATQNQRVIFIMTASFHINESGLLHQTKIMLPPLPNPADFVRIKQQYQDQKTNKYAKLFNPNHNLFEVVTTAQHPWLLHKDGQAKISFWIRAKSDSSIDVILEYGVLALASDMGVLFASIAPYDLDFSTTTIASLDHSLWLHNTPDMKNWHYITAKSNWANKGRGLVSGQVYDTKGVLVASIMQEGLIRGSNKKNPI